MVALRRETERPFTPADRQKGRPVVGVHPPVQDRVYKRGAHGHDVKQGEEQFEVFHTQHAAVDVHGQLEHVEGQPADGKHHHHGDQHLSGPLPALVMVVSTPVRHILHFLPDTDVGKAVNGQRQTILNNEHGHAVDAAVHAAPRPLLYAHLDEFALL